MCIKAVLWGSCVENMVCNTVYSIAWTQDGRKQQGDNDSTLPDLQHEDRHMNVIGTYL